MKTFKIFAVAIALSTAAAGVALAQEGTPAGNASKSGGPGTHQSSQKTGSAENNQKVLHNQNGYAPTGPMQRHQ